MTRDCTQADLQMRAVVAQRTGEDWRGVKLHLSTAAPMSWTELPELGAIRIGRAQPPPPSQKGFRPPPQGAGSLFGDYDRGLGSARSTLPVIPSWNPPALDGAVALPQTQAFVVGAGRGGPMAPPEMDVMSALEDVAEEEAVMEKPARPESRRMMAPPAPPPAAAPMMPMASMARPGAAMPMKAKKMASRERARDEFDDEGGGEAEGSLDVILYASLRLGPAGIPTRGSLTP
ncbi:MAG: DUF4139 domain-containing protein, partial [Burkholderiales bacterium]